MNTLTQFSREERALYNPAFTALVTCRAVQGHEVQYSRPCPIAVAVLSAVMALQPAVRRTLPKTLNSGLTRWLEENKGVKVTMSQNATALAAVVRPGLLLALQSDALHVDEEGQLTVARGRLTKTINGATDEVQAIQKAALLLGRWLPSTGSLSTVMTLLGVRP
ncbi:three component ABC system middle component [Streptomyces rishiriensis]|uniref:three component ABC system middle component n=1 Tax=Streptomyces rishiriensis TaxID=68264 RepID=UPI000D5950C9|nr:three component ABC system middle component [Streptomyces rishiriensis]